MEKFEGHQPTGRARARLLRIDQAAAILRRSPRTVRYHARIRRWPRVRGLVREEDVNALKEYLDSYYRSEGAAGERRCAWRRA